MASFVLQDTSKIKLLTAFRYDISVQNSAGEEIRYLTNYNAGATCKGNSIKLNILLTEDEDIITSVLGLARTVNEIIVSYKNEEDEVTAVITYRISSLNDWSIVTDYDKNDVLRLELDYSGTPSLPIKPQDVKDVVAWLKDTNRIAKEDKGE